MTDWPLSIARPAIAKLTPYSARGGATNALHLDANESPYAPPPVSTAKDYNRYPEQQPAALRGRLAALYNVTPDMVMIGRGADEGIEILIRSFCEANKDSILICPPTFGYYKTCADIQGAITLEAPLKEDYSWDKALIRQKVKDASSLKAIFLCTPNNPTGNEVDRDFVLQLASENPQILIVIDEAYIEFTDSDSYASLIIEFPNIVVLRTLSKVYALAGVRGGVAIADKRVIDIMLTVLPPYPIPRPVEKAINLALSSSAIAVHDERLAETLAERDKMSIALTSSPFIEQVFPSTANFFLLKLNDNKSELFEALSKANVKIRHYPNIDRVRLSIGSPAENQIALRAFGVSDQQTTEQRIGETFRKTNETDIAVRVNLDDPKTVKIDTGLGFFDHMLEQIAKHGGMGLTLSCEGDLEIDAHHTVEDVALAFGTALKQALGNKAGIGRYGFVMPMDETQARIAIDLSGRPAFVWKGTFPTDHVGEFPAEMCPHFFQSLSQTLGASIQIDVEGENTHHMIEASFKGVGRALRPAFAIISDDIPSTKGTL